jgi:hypothetical protein
MNADTVNTSHETDNRRSGAEACPLCGGPLQQLRGLVRCCRCFFAMCEGCDGGAAEG